MILQILKHLLGDNKVRDSCVVKLVSVFEIIQFFTIGSKRLMKIACSWKLPAIKNQNTAWKTENE